MNVRGSSCQVSVIFVQLQADVSVDRFEQNSALLNLHYNPSSGDELFHEDCDIDRRAKMSKPTVNFSNSAEVLKKWNHDQKNCFTASA